MKQYLKIPLLIILANTCAFSQESEGGANLDETAQVRISKVTFTNGTKLQNDDGSEMGLIPGTTRPSDADTPILPQMIDEVDNDTNENFPDGFPDKTNQLKPNHVKSYAYSYEYTAPTIEGIFKWKGAPPTGQCTAWAEVIDTDNCNFKLPPKPLEGNVRYPTTTSAEKIVIQRKIQAYLTSNRRVERKGKAAVGAVADNMSAKCKPLKIRWTVKTPDGKEHWSDSLHTIYVTWAAPTTTLRQETLFNLSCVMGNGKVAGTAAEQEGVYKDIYSEFEDLVVNRMDSLPLRYYFNPKIAAPAGITPQQMTGSLIIDRDSQCDQWATFLVDCCRIQSINSQIKVVMPKINASGKSEFMAVKKWEFKGAGSLAQQPYGGIYTHINIPTANGYTDMNWIDFEVEDLTGISGQGVVQNPLSLFNNHKLVNAFDKYYDPSYGKIYDGVFDAAGNGSSFEKDAISAFAEYPVGSISLDEANEDKDINADGDKVDVFPNWPLFIFRPNLFNATNTDLKVINFPY